jgi:hypothetical protein
MKNAELCPVCQLPSKIQEAGIMGQHLFHIICPRCGQYQIDYALKGYLNLEEYQSKSAILSHAIRKMQKNNEIPSLDFEIVKRILQNPLPKPSEQANNFVLWLGDHIPSLGDKFRLDGISTQAEIGSRTQEGLEKVVDYLAQKKLIEYGLFYTSAIFDKSKDQTDYDATLTMEGWEYYEKLRHGGFSSRRAFIAMKFGDNDLDAMLSSCFRPAVKDTGFELFRLDDVPKAGLIDDRLRVEIRASRFLIADLTHENAGAYWEAGFAEGLGKPVIYTCEKKKFEEKKTHFDTNHHTTVIWDKDELESTARNLKNTIRATLPEEAKMNDEE